MPEELIIVGAGPAGLTAGIYAARKNIGLLVINDFLSYGGQLLNNPRIDNYPGFMGITGFELTTNIREQLEIYGFRNETAKIKNVKKDDSLIVIEAESKTSYKTKALIVATGNIPKQLDVPGEKKLTGKGISYCATCDGPLYRDKTVAVIGNNRWSYKTAFEMAEIARKVYYIKTVRDNENQGSGEEAVENIEIIEDVQIKAFEGEDHLRSIKLRAGTKDTEIISDGAFIEIGKEPNTALVRDLVKLNDRKEIIIDRKSATDIPGIFAAGDCTDFPYKQIITAASQGAVAALSAHEYLSGFKNRKKAGQKYG